MLSRGRLRAFWLAAWLLIGLVGGTLGSAGRIRRGGALGVSIWAVGTLPGFVRPALARWPYRAWNRGAHHVSESATVYTAWVTHLTTTVPLDPAALDAVPGKPLNLESRWLACDSDSSARCPAQSINSLHPFAQGAPLREVYRWICSGDRPRGRWLVVCLATLRWLQTPGDNDQQRRIPADTYTLY